MGELLYFHSSNSLLHDTTTLSQISCAFSSLESHAGIRYSVDLLPREDGSAQLVTTLSYLCGKRNTGYCVGFTCFRARAFCSSKVCRDALYASEEATCKLCCSLAMRAGQGQ